MVMLVDLENVSIDAVKGLGTLTEQDKVYLFFQKSYRFIVPRTEATVECINLIYEGKDNLDKQILVVLGEICPLIQEGEEVIVISKDNGFDAPLTFAARRFGVTIRRVVFFGKDGGFKEPPLTSYSNKEIYKQIVSADTPDSIYRILASRLGKRGSLFYSEMKGELIKLSNKKSWFLNFKTSPKLQRRAYEMVDELTSREEV